MTEHIESAAVCTASRINVLTGAFLVVSIPVATIITYRHFDAIKTVVLVTLGFIAIALAIWYIYVKYSERKAPPLWTDALDQGPVSLKGDGAATPAYFGHSMDLTQNVKQDH